MKKLLVLGTLFLTVGLAWFSYKNPSIWAQLRTQKNNNLLSPVLPQPTPLAKYSFEALAKRKYEPSEIKLERVMKDDNMFTAYVFSMNVDGQKVTGQANIPKKTGKLPVVVMIRGYAEKEGYFTGSGSYKAAGEFAKAGFITLAPDFLGYGGSDPESSDILEVRFAKPITVLTLLESIQNIPQANSQNVFIWAHSNGGQITLSVLEITKRPIPATLWAPVTRGFPESVLAFIKDLDDQGQMVVSTISAFTKDYNPKLFSIDTYFADITAPLQLHQGTGDILVKTSWSETFVKTMRSLNKNMTYYTYHKDDHNLKYNWKTVIQRDIAFFKKHLK